MIERYFVDDVDVINPPAATVAGRYGNAGDVDWKAAVPTPTVGRLIPRKSVEDTNDRDTLVVTPDLLLPAGTVITARSRVRVRGLTYDVDAEPTTVRNGRGEHHIAVVLKRVQG